MDTKNALAVLENSPLFAVLTPEERTLLQRGATLQTYGKQSVLYKPGPMANKVY
ncbi:MAG: hypothetical protein IT261_02385, partial [Saprospiraceae bacterium]|nr:hypothetical protein [Saprospiraceae bacterium]